jgi:hypothetical protein
MVRHNIRLRVSSTGFKRITYRPKIRTGRFIGRGRFGDVLDSNISLRSLLKYAAIILLFIAVLGFVFALGKYYGQGAHQEKQTTTIAKETADNEIEGDAVQTLKETEKEELPETEPDTDTETVQEEEPRAEPEPETTTQTTQNDIAVTETVTHTTTTETPKQELCAAKPAGFDYPYSMVNVTVNKINKEKKSDNWAVMTSVEISITNGESCIITNPTQIKLKMNNKGKGSNWWDDEVFLPETFQKLMPGETVSETVPVHVSYSDIYMEKDFKLVVFDDYGIDMATYKKYVTLT